MALGKVLAGPSRAPNCYIYCHWGTHDGHCIFHGFSSYRINTVTVHIRSVTVLIAIATVTQADVQLGQKPSGGRAQGNVRTSHRLFDRLVGAGEATARDAARRGLRAWDGASVFGAPPGLHDSTYGGYYAYRRIRQGRGARARQGRGTRVGQRTGRRSLQRSLRRGLQRSLGRGLRRGQPGSL